MGKLIAYLTLCLLLCGCKVKQAVVTADISQHKEVQTEYIHVRDSFVQRDSVFVIQMGDTVYHYKEKYIYNPVVRVEMRTDTVIKRDSIRVEVPVAQETGAISNPFAFASAFLFLGGLVTFLVMLKLKG